SEKATRRYSQIKRKIQRKSARSFSYTDRYLFLGGNGWFNNVIFGENGALILISSFCPFLVYFAANNL
ncbi:MAG TPA: hypothetical protein PLW64_09130, partial [Niabella sp.]|nr:hypothetical protein [Niabella sp.]